MILSKSIPFKKVAIHSVPRSGSTWLGQVFNSNPSVAYRFQPLFSYAFKDRLSEKSSLNDINSFYNDLLNTRDSFVLQSNEASLSKKGPEFLKDSIPTHIVYKEVRYNHIIEHLLKTDKDILIIGIIRNPKAVISSWLNSPKEFREDLGWNFFREWRSAKAKNQDRAEEFFGFNKWKEITTLFLRLKEKYPNNFYLVRYDDLLSNTHQTVKELFSFTGLELVSSTANFLTESRNRNDKDTYGVYKNHLSDTGWKNKLDKQIVSEIEYDLKNSELEQFLH